MAVIPNTNPMLAMFDPMTLLMAIAGESLIAALILTNNSGADVAKDTTVRPMTIFDMLNLKDNPTEALTRNSPPKTNSANPPSTYNMFSIKIFFCEDTISFYM